MIAHDASVLEASPSFLRACCEPEESNAWDLQEGPRRAAGRIRSAKELLEGSLPKSQGLVDSG